MSRMNPHACAQYDQWQRLASATENFKQRLFGDAVKAYREFIREYGVPALPPAHRLRLTEACYMGEKYAQALSYLAGLECTLGMKQ